MPLGLIVYFLLNKNCLRRVSKLNSFLPEPPEYFHVYPLLNIHVNVIIGVGNKINHFKIQRKISVLFKVNAVKTGVLRFFDKIADNLLDGLNLCQWCLVNNAETENDPSLRHAFIITDTTFQKIVIRKDDLFATETADSRGF